MKHKCCLIGNLAHFLSVPGPANLPGNAAFNAFCIMLCVVVINAVESLFRYYCLGLAYTVDGVYHYIADYSDKSMADLGTG
jgi:hypothetical protein